MARFTMYQFDPLPTPDPPDPAHQTAFQDALGGDIDAIDQAGAALASAQAGPVDAVASGLDALTGLDDDLTTGEALAAQLDAAADLYDPTPYVDEAGTLVDLLNSDVADAGASLVDVTIDAFAVGAVPPISITGGGGLPTPGGGGGGIPITPIAGAGTEAGAGGVALGLPANVVGILASVGLGIAIGVGIPLTILSLLGINIFGPNIEYLNSILKAWANTFLDPKKEGSYPWTMDQVIADYAKYAWPQGATIPSYWQQAAKDQAEAHKANLDTNYYLAVQAADAMAHANSDFELVSGPWLTNALTTLNNYYEHDLAQLQYLAAPVFSQGGGQ